MERMNPVVGVPEKGFVAKVEITGGMHPSSIHAVSILFSVSICGTLSVRPPMGLIEYFVIAVDSKLHYYAITIRCRYHVRTLVYNLTRLHS